MRVSAKNIKAAEDAAGNHNDDGDKQYRVKHGRAADLEAPSVLNNSRCTGSVRLNQQKGMSPMCSTSSVGCSRPLSGGGIRCAHFLCLILLNQSVASLGHAGARRFIRRSSIKVSVAKCHVTLALLK
jgi:hypothetical protein